VGTLEDQIQERRNKAKRGKAGALPAGLESDPKSFLLPVGLVHVSDQARKSFSGIEALAELIKEEGQLQPIVVERLSSGGYGLIAGERRLRAVRDVLKKEKIRATLKGEDLDKTERRFIQLVENTQREDYEPLDLAEEILDLKIQTGQSDIQLGERIGVDRSWIFKQCALAQAPEEIKARIRSGDLAPTTYLNNKKAYLEKRPRRVYVKIPYEVSIKVARMIEAISKQGEGAQPVKLGRKPKKTEVIALLDERIDDLVAYLKEKEG